MKRITIPEEGVETLFGSYDENLKHLESLFNVRIRTQGHELLVEGNAPDLARVEGREPAREHHPEPDHLDERRARHRHLGSPIHQG